MNRHEHEEVGRLRAQLEAAERDKADLQSQLFGRTNRVALIDDSRARTAILAVALNLKDRADTRPVATGEDIATVQAEYAHVEELRGLLGTVTGFEHDEAVELYELLST